MKKVFSMLAALGIAASMVCPAAAEATTEAETAVAAEAEAATEAEATTEADAMETSTEAETTAVAEVASGAVAADATAEGESLQIGQIYAAAHGDKCFTEAVAVVSGDKIVAAYIDDFQFMDATAVTGVPNSDGGFGEGYADGVVLASKRVNTKYYSDMMTQYANATVAIDANYDAIQEYAVGKTIDEIDATASSETPTDAVSGATLADTGNYLKAIADAARAAQENPAVTFTGDPAALKLNVQYGAAHGDKCFTTAAVLTDGSNIILSWIDEFQFLDAAAEGVTGVPNSDGGFAEGYADGVVLGSKRVNTGYYSDMMKQYANATVAIDANYDAIQAYADTLSIDDAEALAGKDDAVDSVSGATLADTASYIGLIADTAKQ